MYFQPASQNSSPQQKRNTCLFSPPLYKTQQNTQKVDHYMSFLKWWYPHFTPQNDPL